MHVLVGSNNPVKRRAVQKTVGDRVDSVQLCSVDSGVSDQPWGHANTLKGARNRAVQALETANGDLAVGLEGGVCTHQFTDGLYVIMWGVATNGIQSDRAAGPQFQLPAAVADRVRDGTELGPALDEYLGKEGTKFGGGAAAAVSDGLTNRATALGQAVAGSVGPLLADLSH